MKEKSIVLLSGGLDSSLALMRAHEDTSILFALTFDYGQRSAQKEIEAAQKICSHYKINTQICNLHSFFQIKNHPLFDSQVTCPSITEKQLDDLTASTSSAKTVWVPNRNGIFLNIAAGLAEHAKAHTLYVGFNAEEAQTFPDNSQEFLVKTNEALFYSTLNHVQAKAPTLSMMKKEILKTLMESDFPISYLWSCYLHGEKMCGRCESCQRLRRALFQNHLSKKEKELFLC